MIDHRGPEFAKLAKLCLEGIKTIFKTTKPVIIYTATGTGAWEAALVNTLSPGDRVLMVETGQFATLWKNMAEKLGLRPEFIKTDWRTGAEPGAIEERLRKDKDREIKAVCVLHNETSTGCLSPVPKFARRSMPPATRAVFRRYDLLARLDRLSSRRMGRRRHRRWRAEGVDAPARDVFQCDQRQGARGSEDAKMSKSFWAWDDMLNMNKIGFFPYTPATQMLHGLAEGSPCCTRKGSTTYSRAMAARRGDARRGARLGAGDHVPRCEILFADSDRGDVPAGHDADAFRSLALETFNISYGSSFGPYAANISASAISATSTTGC